MRIKSWYTSQSDVVKAALIGSLVAGILAGIFAIVNTELGKPSPQAVATPKTSQDSLSPTLSATAPPPPPPTAPTSTSSSPTASPACTAKLGITQPAEDAIVANGADGVVIKGVACGLGSDSGWLFDFDPEGGYYYDDYGGSTPTPVVRPSQTGAWQYPDSPIGDPGDQDKQYAITLVLAPPACDRRLRSAPQIDGDYKLRAFPAGCSIVGTVTVYVTYPQN